MGRRPHVVGSLLIGTGLFVLGCTAGHRDVTSGDRPDATASTASLPINVLSRPVPGPATGGCELLEQTTVRELTGFSLTDLTVRIRGTLDSGPHAQTLCLFSDTLSNSVLLSVSSEAADGARIFGDAVGIMEDPLRLAGPGEAAAWESIGYQGRLEVLAGERHVSLAVILLQVPPERLLAIATGLAEAILTRV